MLNSNSVIHYLLADFELWVTILGMLGDHPSDGVWPSILWYQFTWSQHTKYWSPAVLRTLSKFLVGRWWVVEHSEYSVLLWAKTWIELARWPAGPSWTIQRLGSGAKKILHVWMTWRGPDSAGASEGSFQAPFKNSMIGWPDTSYLILQRDQFRAHGNKLDQYLKN